MQPTDEWLKHLSDQHYIAVGKAVHAWAQMETLIYTYIREYSPSAPIRDWAVGRFRPLNERCDLLGALIRSRYLGVSESLLCDVEIQLKNVLSLSKQRNVFAHNPVMYWIEEQNQQPAVVQRIVSGATGADTKFDLDALLKCAAETDELMHSLMLSIVRLGIVP